MFELKQHICTAVQTWVAAFDRERDLLLLLLILIRWQKGFGPTVSVLESTITLPTYYSVYIIVKRWGGKSYVGYTKVQGVAGKVGILGVESLLRFIALVFPVCKNTPILHSDLKCPITFGN